MTDPFGDNDVRALQPSQKEKAQRSFASFSANAVRAKQRQEDPDRPKQRLMHCAKKLAAFSPKRSVIPSIGDADNDQRADAASSQPIGKSLARKRSQFPEYDRGNGHAIVRSSSFSMSFCWSSSFSCSSSFAVRRLKQ